SFLSSRRRRAALVLLAVALSVALAGPFVWKRRSSAARARRSAAPDVSAPEVQALLGADISRQPIEIAGGSDFVGSGACKGCHREIAGSFAAHPMRRSLASIAEAVPIEDYLTTMFAPPGPRRYRIERRDERVWHHEEMLAADSVG